MYENIKRKVQKKILKKFRELGDGSYNLEKPKWTVRCVPFPIWKILFFFFQKESGYNVAYVAIWV